MADEIREQIPGTFRLRTKAKRLKGGQLPSAWGPYKNHENGPNPHEKRCTTWGFLLAAAWFSNELIEPPTREYLEVLAELHGLAVPNFTEADGCLSGEELT